MKEQTGPIKRCPECGQGQLSAISQNEEFDFDLGDKTVKVVAADVPVEQCDQCDEILSGPAAAMVRHEAICRAVGLMTPLEIKSLREAIGWTREQLADYTGFGIATVSLWERGRLLPNRSENNLLSALRDDPTFRGSLQHSYLVRASVDAAVADAMK